MTEIVRKTLRDSKAARWSALLIVSFTMFAGYFLSDAMSPLQGMLQKELNWNSADYGWFTGSYGWFNVFLFFIIFGGIILDKMGVRFTGITSAIIMICGVALKYWAITTHSMDGLSFTFIIWNFKAQVWMAALGYAIFGVGVEVAGITVSKIVVKWFKGHELALAMGLQLAIARLGTALALSTSLPIAKAFGHVSVPILIALIMLCIGLLAFFVYAVNDRKLDKSISDSQTIAAEEEFHMSDILFIIKNKGWWYIAILCALFYSAVFPFLKYATYFMINKFDVDENWAGLIPGLLPFGTILLTPLFGNLYDRKGKGASIMILGSFIITMVHLLFSIPFLNQWFVAILLMIILGIGFSLVPSAMWPSLPKIIPDKQLGTAFALIFWVQNAIALMLVPAMIGWVLNRYCITSSAVINGQTVTHYNYTLPMLIFSSLGILAIVVAFLLKAEDKKKGYGLELPNIKK
jgi:predicted MFS family arabinose efflux permease